MKISSKFMNRFLIITGIIWLLVDIIVVVTGNFTSTISYRMWVVGKSFIFIPFAFGTLMSHFFAPDYFSKKIPKLRYFIWISLSLFVLIISIFTPIHIHPFIMLILGLGNGMFWAQYKLEEKTNDRYY